MLHDNPNNALEIINLLSSPNSRFYIHFDAKYKGDLSCFASIKNVNLAKLRFSIEWGGFSIVEAVLQGCKEIIDIGASDYVILLSGADFPVKDNSFIENYISSNENIDFITGSPLPNKNSHWLEGGRRRIETYAVRLGPKQIATIEPRKYDWNNIRQFIKIARYNVRKLPFTLRLFFKKEKRCHPKGLSPYGGEMWWGLRIETIKKLLEYIKTHPEYAAYHHDTCIPDELFFNTLIYNIIPLREISNNCLRYINWDKGNPGCSPMEFKLGNMVELKRLILDKSTLFARKITDPNIIDFIKDSINQHNNFR